MKKVEDGVIEYHSEMSVQRPIGMVREIDKEVKQLREEGGPGSEQKIEELYRDKYALKQLGDSPVEAEKDGRTGRLRVANRGDVKRQAEEIQRAQQKEKSRERGR